MTQEKALNIKPRERLALLQSLRAGVVPRTGQHLIQVGRAKEIETLVADVETLVSGGSTFRIVTGEYGAGKTFFLNLVRSIALEKKLVTVSADLNPDRRLHASGGQARSLYAELMRNIATRAKPEGGACESVLAKFINQSREEAEVQGVSAEQVVRRKLATLSELVNGYDFAEVVAGYCRGDETGDEALKANAVRWLRGEFATKTDARQCLGVRSIVGDSEVYDQLKLLALFVRLSGYAGLLVCLDEMVNLYKLANTQARNANYEQILRILNDSLQGTAEGLGFILGGTPEFLMDPRRGLYSYPALQSRLAQNSFAKDGLVDFSGPVIRLSALRPEEFYLLLRKLRDIHASGLGTGALLPDQGIRSFMEHCNARIGDSYFRTPRTTIVAFINLLAVLEQNPTAKWEDLLGGIAIAADTGGAADTADIDDELAEFKL
jgi:hypothetical protein